MADQDIYEWIDDYDQKKLSPEDVIAFESRLKNDEEFAATVENHRALVYAIKSKEVRDFRNIASEIIEDVTQEGKKKQNRKWLGLSIGILLISALVYFVFQEMSNATTSPVDICHAYFKVLERPNRPVYNAEPPLGVAGTKQNNLFNRAYRAYALQSYDEAEGLFDSLLVSTSIAGQTYLYKGISQMSLNQYEEAGQSFKKITNEEIKNVNDEISAHAFWFLALSYLCTNSPEKGREIFLKIRGEQNNNYKELAKNILDEL